MLKVWFPGTNDTEDYGLGGTQWINDNVVITDNGKLGKCLSFNGSNSRLSTTTFNLSNEWSFCFWAKCNNASSGWMALWTLGDNNDSNVTAGYFLIPTQSRSQISFNGTYNSGLSLSSPTEWTHYAGSWDGTKLVYYINGVQVYQNTYTKAYLQKTNLTIGGESNDSTNGGHGAVRIPFNGLLNDFRIYDGYILSPREVKEISTALVLHYSLAMPGQENLQQGTTSIGATNVPGWVSNGGGTTLEKIDGNIIHFKRTISDSKVIPTIVLNCVTPCDFNSSYVYSIDLKFDRDIITTGSTPAHFWWGARNTDSIFNTSCNGNLSNRSSSIISPSASTVIPANTWYTQKVRINFGDGPTSEGYDYPAIRCFVYGSVLTENYTGEVNGWMKNCKIEEGEIATPWIPNPADAEYSTLGFDDGIEYDVSGYGNNGTKYGTLTYSSDTSRYNTSTVFNGTDNCIQFPFNDFCTNGDVFTMNIWWKKTVLGSKAYETLIGGPSGFEMDTRSGSAQYLSLYMTSARGGNVYPSFNMNEWYMVTLVNDGTNELYYVNGTLVNTIEKKNMPSGNYYVGAWKNETGQNFNGFMSDFRFYKTALSPSDILELYHTSASLADNGTLMAYQFNEV